LDKATEQLHEMAIYQIFQERSVFFDTSFFHHASPYRKVPIRIYSGRREGGSTPLFMERPLDDSGHLRETMRYNESFLEFAIKTPRLLTDSGFSEVAVQVFRPAVWLEKISFKMDTGDFFISPLERNLTGVSEMLFNVKPGFEMQGLTVTCEKNPPIIVTAKKAKNIAYFESFDMGRFVFGLDVKQYLAAWGSFFEKLKRPGDELHVKFTVFVKPPDFFIQESYSGESDPPFESGRLPVFRQLIEGEEIPSTEPFNTLVFHFERLIKLKSDMFM